VDIVNMEQMPGISDFADMLENNVATNGSTL